MKKIEIISATPELLESPFSGSIMKRAVEKKIVEINFHDLKNYSSSKKKQIDDYQFGGGSGMVMSIQPIDDCISKLKQQRDYDEIIFLSPDGKTLNQQICNTLSTQKNLILLCGHYKGIDQRVRELHITKEISIGDYVLTGGEAAAAILTDAIVRLIPGAISDETSALTDSFQDNMLAPPIYTRPAEYKGMKVPEVLLSGNEKKITEWREKEAIKITEQKRPDLLE